jgi:hypothetical protein
VKCQCFAANRYYEKHNDKKFNIGTKVKNKKTPITTNNDLPQKYTRNKKQKHQTIASNTIRPNSWGVHELGKPT